MPHTKDMTNTDSTYAIIESWENYGGSVSGYNEAGDEVIEIGPAGKETATTAKWGERVLPGRAWAAYLPSGEIVHGRSADLRAAKRDALAAVTERVSA